MFHLQHWKIKQMHLSWKTNLSELNQSIGKCPVSTGTAHLITCNIQMQDVFQDAKNDKRPNFASALTSTLFN